jgi:hypothetical protein
LEGLLPGSWVARLHDAGLKPGTLKRLDDGTWEVNLDNTTIKDLAILEGARISELSFGYTAVTDLSPLRGMPLRNLQFYRSKVTDLRPLAGMSLNRLNLGGTIVTDLAALRGMALTELYLHNCDSLTDLSPLAEATKLTKLTLPQGAANFEFLRNFPGLERLSYRQDRNIAHFPDQSAAGFWRDYDNRKRIRQAEFWLAEGRVDDALSLLAEVASGIPSDTLFATRVAALQIWFGKDADHAATCARMLKWAGNTESPVDAELVAKIVSLRPVADTSQREAALVLGRRSVELGQKRQYLSYFKMALGMAAYRGGHYAEANEALASAPGLVGALGEPHLSRIQAVTGFYRAMSLFRQGKPDEAGQLFTATEAKMKPFPSDENNPLAGNGTDANHDDLIAWLACKEAKALLAGPGAPKK